MIVVGISSSATSTNGDVAGLSDIQVHLQRPETILGFTVRNDTIQLLSHELCKCGLMQKPVTDYKRSMILGALAGISLAVVFASGFFFRDLINLPSVLAVSPGIETEDYALLDEVQILLDQHYLREQPSATQREYAAIRGMLASLEDRYTFFIEPPVAQSESDVLAGTYGGIGVQVQRSEEGELLLYPFPESPAAAAGIKDGDVLQAINGVTVDLTQPLDSIDQMIRGEVKEGHGVEISVISAHGGEEFTVFIAFAVINVPSVVWRVLTEDTHIGYLQILRFTSRTPEELTNALNDLRESNVSALILDLRNNSGGLLQESVEVASEFIESGVIVYERDPVNEHSFDDEPGGLATELPLAVLVNQGTASAAELVAGAIQDHDRGILVGQTTYGKGSVQQIFRLSDDSSLHITSAEWFTPDHNTLDGVGLQPDIPMIPDVNGRDVELGEALRHLQQEMTP
jgi:carboxyl-terminal processing protease